MIQLAGIIVVLAILLDGLLSGTLVWLLGMTLTGYVTYLVMQHTGQTALQEAVTSKHDDLAVRLDTLQAVKDKHKVLASFGAELMDEFGTTAPTYLEVFTRIEEYEKKHAQIRQQLNINGEYDYVLDALQSRIKVLEEVKNKYADRMEFAGDMQVEFGTATPPRSVVTRRICDYERQKGALVPLTMHQMHLIELKAKLAGFAAFLCPPILLWPLGLWFWQLHKRGCFTRLIVAIRRIFRRRHVAPLSFWKALPATEPRLPLQLGAGTTTGNPNV